MKLLSGERNQCQSCKEYFNSVRAFERHRMGTYGVDRRCRTPEELLALGCSLNKDGFWITKKRPEDSYTPRSLNDDD
jgi:hypothetical protein